MIIVGHQVRSEPWLAYGGKFKAAPYEYGFFTFNPNE